MGQPHRRGVALRALCLHTLTAADHTHTHTPITQIASFMTAQLIGFLLRMSCHQPNQRPCRYCGHPPSSHMDCRCVSNYFVPYAAC